MSATRVFDILDRYRKIHKTEVALAGKENGQWKKYDYKAYIEMANHISYGLLAMGLKRGDKVATIFSNNRPEWNFLDMGFAQIGVIHVPIYPTISHEEYLHIFNHSEVKYVFISDKLLHRKVRPAIDEVKNIKKVFTIQPVDGVESWKTVLELGKKSESYFKVEVEKIKNSISSKDLTTIIYTSGTTGRSKGVMLSHENIMSNVHGVAKCQHLPSGSRILSFLPLCHVFERTMIYKYQYLGMHIYYAENIGTIGDNIREVKPHGFDTVPRLLEAVFEKIIAKGNAQKGIKRKLFFWAVDLGYQYNEDGNSWFYDIQLKIADKLIFSKWREALGGELDFIASGSAALQPKLERIFAAAGLQVFQGYGLTETAPIVTTNFKINKTVRFGTVGPTLENVEVKIANDGEILVKGPNIMMGYYKDKQKTAETIDDEGWFHTGDVGMIVSGRFLKITDRKKEMFKTSAGKYIAPQPIENKFKESFFIQQAIVVGENQKFASAILLPNFDFLQKWAREQGINFSDKAELIEKTEVQKRIQQEVNTVNKTLGQVEQIKRFRLIADEWSPISGELSPTLKLKRKVIQQKYQNVLEEIYLK